MPQQQKSIKVIIAEALICVGMFVVVGHLAADFYERFVIQSELTNMQTSLHTLKDAINNIESAYDNLYDELKGIATEDKATYKPEPIKRNKKRSHTLNKEDKDIQVQAVMQARKLLDIDAFNREVVDFMQQCNVWSGRNISTLTTRSSCNSGAEKNYSLNAPKRSTGCIHRCYNCSIADDIIYPTLY